MNAHAHARGDWHGTLTDYVLGFLLSAALTALSFWLVMSGVVDGRLATAWLIVGLAAAQMIVQVRFFLHVSAQSESGWTMVSLLFTLIIVVITLAGSFWVMHHLDQKMMPAHEMDGVS